MEKMIIELDMCCEVLLSGPSNEEIDLHFENGDVWSDPDFKKFGVKIHSVHAWAYTWPTVRLEGTEEELRAYLEHYNWDDADYYLKECKI